jgi:aminoglycoside phosphotransferase (APT) family kinase protein
MDAFVKRREPARPGSIAEALDIFRSELRFYREIAPVIGIRVPACYRAEESDAGTVLELENLSTWKEGADPTAAAKLLRELHDRWTDDAVLRWPWLRPIGAAADLVERLYDETWPKLAARESFPPVLRDLGDSLVGNVRAAEQLIRDAGPLTLVHGDASARNLRTSPEGEIALLDWEDVSAAPGILDLGWFLLSSADPADWPATIDAYGNDEGLSKVMPSLVVQGFLSLADYDADTVVAEGWRQRLRAAAKLLDS